MTLSEFLVETKRELDSFETWWRTMHAEFPEEFPMETDIDDLGERMDWWSGPWFGTFCPKFTEDLNQIHQALIRLPFDGLVKFVRELYIILDEETKVEVGMEVLEPVEVMVVLFKSTAAQQAEALMKALGVFKET